MANPICEQKKRREAEYNAFMKSRLDIISPRATQLWAKKLAEDTKRESRLAQLLPPPRPLTRRERIAYRFRNWCNRFRCAWLVLRRDYEIEED